MKRGFTLVELSIVLVIIGLLIGGILVGQSLIESTKINKFVSQIQQFDIAVQQFKVKYKSLPGDTDKLPPGTAHATLNNGFIENGLIRCCGGNYTTEFSRENKNFWPHLQVIGFKIDGITEQMPLDNNSPPGVKISGSEQNVPKIVIGENTGVIPFTRNTSVSAGTRPFGSGTIVSPVDFKAGNFYFIADFSTTTTHQISTGGNATRYWRESIPVDSSLSIDQKMDDGSMYTGDVINASYHSSGCSIATANYNVNATLPCALMIRMDY